MIDKIGSEILRRDWLALKLILHGMSSNTDGVFVDPGKDTEEISRPRIGIVGEWDLILFCPCNDFKPRLCPFVDVLWPVFSFSGDEFISFYDVVMNESGISSKICSSTSSFSLRFVMKSYPSSWKLGWTVS